MAAYCFIDILEITDLGILGQYRHDARATLEKYGGRYVLAGGAVDVVEGNWQPVFPILIEFPTRQQAHCWYGSDEYRPLKALLESGMKVNVVILEGMLEGFGQEPHIVR
jgi:uncharacterized protein (DUF1330 family)